MSAPEAVPAERPARLPRGRRRAVHLVGAGLWLSGALWLLFHYAVPSADPFGLGRHPLEPWWLSLHGAFGFAGLWLLGVLWGVHMVAGWTSAERRRSGSAMLGALAGLVITGYLLYYLDDAALRSTVSVLHWSVGLALPLAFLAHRGRGRRTLEVRKNRPHDDGVAAPCSGFAFDSKIAQDP